MTSANELVGELRVALKHLYDPKVLRSSSLVSSLKLPRSETSSAELRRVLIHAISALKPDSGTPPDSRMWRTYEILRSRFIEQFSQAQVAAQLRLGVRQLRREEHVALESLAHVLAHEHKIELASTPPAASPQATTASGDMSEAQLEALDESSSALLQHPAMGGSADLDEIIPAVIRLVESLAVEHDVTLTAPEDNCPFRVDASPVLLRQGLLSLLSVAIRQSTGGAVEIGISQTDLRITISIHACPVGSGNPLSPDDLANLDAAARLAEALHASLVIDSKTPVFACQLDLDRAATIQLLVIDDHRDALQLFERYTKGTRYHLHGVSDPEQALARAANICPDIIVLDVMMPGVDGWQVLDQLRRSPPLDTAPVVVCTVLPHADLARSCGASGFIAKPVTRQAFLQALEAALAGSAW